MGCQEENADTIPAEIPCKPVVYLDGTTSGQKPAEHHIRKMRYFTHKWLAVCTKTITWITAVFYGQSRTPERVTETTGKITLKLTLCKHKEINYRTNHFFGCFQSIIIWKIKERNRYKLVSVLTYFRCTDLIHTQWVRSAYKARNKRRTIAQEWLLRPQGTSQFIVTRQIKRQIKGSIKQE